MARLLFLCIVGQLPGFVYALCQIVPLVLLSLQTRQFDPTSLCVSGLSPLFIYGIYYIPSSSQ